MSLGALLLLVGLAQAAEPGPAPECAPPCGPELGCVLEHARCLIEHQSWDSALQTLRSSRNLNALPEQAGLRARLLSLAYEGAGNEIWARRALAERLEAEPDDLETRTWAIWKALEAGDLVTARAFLAIPDPPLDTPLKARLIMLRALLDHLDGRPESAQAAVLGFSGPLLPGDEPLRRELRRRVLGDTGEPWSARLQAGVGFTTNAIQSAPQDAGGGAVQDSGSPLMALDAVLRFEPWTTALARPLGDLRSKVLLPFSETTRSSAWLDLAARTGMEIGSRTASRGRLLYSFELLGVNSGDLYSTTEQSQEPDGSWPGRRWYMEAHRAEAELDLGERVQLFAGGGKRLYREMGRSRAELDGGAALVLPLGGTWNLTGVLSGRLQDATLAEWDLYGATALLRVAAPLPYSGMLLLRGLTLWDRLDTDNPDGRRDLTWGLQVAPWTRPLAGVRYGVSWTWTDRSSTEESWSYVDHRVMLEARWQPSWGSRAAPLAPAGSDFLPLPTGLGSGSDSGLDRVQDLLRQEDSARRGSSCVD